MWFIVGLSGDISHHSVDRDFESDLGYSMWVGASWGRNVIAFDSHNDRSLPPNAPEKHRYAYSLTYGWLQRDREAFLGARIGPSMLLSGTVGSERSTPGLTASVFAYLTPWVHWGLFGGELFGSYFGHQSFWGFKVSLLEFNILVTSTH